MSDTSTHRTFEIISILSTMVLSTFAFIYSLINYDATDKATALALKRMTELAEANIKSSEANQKIAIETQKSADATTKLANASAENLKYAKQNTDVQINSFNETRRQFQISTDPILQLDIDLDYKSSENGWPDELTYRIKNLGKVPIKITGRKSTMKFEEERKERDLREKLVGLRPDNIIVNDKTQDFTQRVFWPQNMKSQMIDSLDNFKIKMYFLGVCHYTNLATNETKRYEFVIEIFRNEINFIHNSNFFFKTIIQKEGSFGR